MKILKLFNILFLLIFLSCTTQITNSQSTPNEFSIGTAVAPINYYMTAWMLEDLIKTAGFGQDSLEPTKSKMWVPELDWEWKMEWMDQVVTDNLGWPKSLELLNGVKANRLHTLVLGTETSGKYPSGDYTLKWEGEGTLEVSGAEFIETKDKNVALLRYQESNEAIIISITDTDPNKNGNYIKNLQLYWPDHDPKYRSIFKKDYLDYLKPFSVIRPLHMLGEQMVYGKDITWEDRKPLNYSHWGGDMGAPFEVLADLANESDSDLWLNVPISASDNFMKSLAKLMLNRLDNNRLLYIELGNEIWNWSYPYNLGRNYAIEEANKRWPNPSDDNIDMLTFSWQGARTVEMGKIFKEAFGSEQERVIVVACGQVGASGESWYPSRFLLESPIYVEEEGADPVWKSIDAYAIAPYVGDQNNEFSFNRDSPELFIEDAINYTLGLEKWTEFIEEPGLRYQIRSDYKMASEFNLPLLAYEGGQHFMGSKFTRDIVNRNRKMYDLYRTIFKVWKEEGGSLFVNFAGIIPPGNSPEGEEPDYFQSENFGIFEYQMQPISDRHKYRAILDEISKYK